MLKKLLSDITLLSADLMRNHVSLTEDTLLATDRLVDQFQNQLEQLNLSKLEDFRIAFLGKAGLFTALFKCLAKLSLESKKQLSPRINITKQKLVSTLEAQKNQFKSQAIHEKLLAERVDLSLPIHNKELGGIHPLSHTMMIAVEIFSTLGFAIEEGPEIEDEYHNFDALNFPKFHPAKDSHDTFYLKSPDASKKVLRTHTSNVQIRVMQQQYQKLNNNEIKELKFIAPGRVFRSDDDATHTPIFHQIEGLLVSRDASFANLKYILQKFCAMFFQKNISLRFRPSFFPFTTPSFEVDIGYSVINKQVVIGGNDQWLEILGSGMVHPNVLQNCKIDTQTYQGFAFGLGLERIAMLKYGFTDIRTFFSGNYGWAKKYNFSANSTRWFIKS